ncbi:MAG: hypothetical protein ACOY4K_09435 [Pseudomonadota bacterium]
MSPRIVIAGGYGLVGGRIATLLREAGHALDLVLAGRNPDQGAALAGRIGARTSWLDVADPAPGLAALGPVDLVVAALQDPGDNLLAASLRAGAAHIGIVRTAGTMASTAIAAADLARRPALMLGHWQAGVLTWATLAAARAFARVEAVEMAALYDPADPIGPMTSADAGGFIGRALVRRGGTWTEVEAASTGRLVAAAGTGFEAHPMGVLDTPAVAAITGAADVRFDLGVGPSIGSLAGRGASHDLYIDLRGILADGRPGRRRTVVSDPAGQAHLTAAGVVIGVERLLGLDGAPPPPTGLAFPETAVDAEVAAGRLRGMGVRFETAT